MLTDEQILAGVEEFADENYMTKHRGDIFRSVRAIKSEVRKEIESAVLAEREQCAQLADEICRCCFPAVACDAAESVAEEIRARTQPMRTDDAQ